MPAPQRKHNRQRRRKGERRRRQQIAWEDLPQFESMKPRPGDASRLLSLKRGRKRSTPETTVAAPSRPMSPAATPAARREQQENAPAQHR